jgi:hypothetical protein
LKLLFALPGSCDTRQVRLLYTFATSICFLEL